MLLSLLVKATEDSPVSKYVYRPLSRPLTVLLLHTPITANQVSYITGIVGLLGCLVTLWPSQNALIWGAALVFISGIIDGCDGEISRMKLTSSPFGAWLDTIIDELTQITYFVAIGYHTYQHYPHPWVAASIVLGFVCFASTIYGIYYFSLVVIKKGGSQYYNGDLELFEDADGPALRPRIKPASTAPAWAKALGQGVMYMIRRDFINLASLFISFANGFEIIYGGIWLGTVVAAIIVVPEHVRLRRQMAELRRLGAPIRYVG
jgi:phosphatidylglycerophosphate synthase